MKLGVAIFPTDYSIRPDDFARACEERGFESVWFPEHTHIPASRKTPYPAGGDLPEEYWHSHDPFVALMAAAAVTKTIRLATGICLVIERDPITTAKQVSSLDQLSGGRVLFGIGAGWNVEEMANHGTVFRHRWRVLRERVEAMKCIWTKEAAEYHGAFVDFDPIWQYPKPLQKPHPPIILGSASRKSLERVVDYCDGWVPIGFALPDLPGAIRDLHERATAAGCARSTTSASRAASWPCLPPVGTKCWRCSTGTRRWSSSSGGDADRLRLRGDLPAAVPRASESLRAPRQAADHADATEPHVVAEELTQPRGGSREHGGIERAKEVLLLPQASRRKAKGSSSACTRATGESAGRGRDTCAVHGYMSLAGDDLPVWHTHDRQL
jgi:probable F420-dependent oxidoreductase